MLHGHHGEVHCKEFPSIWRLPVPSNAMGMAWRLFLDRMQTQDNLLKRGVALPADTCLLCSCAVETGPHLFFTCVFSWHVWMGIYAWFGVTTVIHYDGLIHYSAFQELARTKCQKRIVGAVWIAVIWCIWNCRNGVVFREEVADVGKVRDQIVFKSWLWLHSKVDNFHFSVYEWRHDLVACLSQL